MTGTLIEKQKWFYLTGSWEIKGFNTFLKVIRPKLNVVTRLDFELAYYNVAV